MIEGGGGEAPFTQRLRRSLADVAWKKHNFIIRKIVDGEEREATSHEMDHVKKCVGGTLALEIEWNNKAEFYDRDLENFKRLHQEGIFSVAILVTRGRSFQNSIEKLISDFIDLHNVTSFVDLEKFAGYDPSRKFRATIEALIMERGLPFREVWLRRFVVSKYASTTTHWAQLKNRLDRGIGNPCPMLLIGLPASIIDLT